MTVYTLKGAFEIKNSFKNVWKWDIAGIILKHLSDKNILTDRRELIIDLDETKAYLMPTDNKGLRIKFENTINDKNI